MQKEKKGILVARTDKIGDLVLSLTVIKTIKKAFPKEPIYLLVSSYASPIVDDLNGIAEVIKYENGPDSLVDVNRNKILVQKIAELNCRAALVLFHDPNVLSIIKKAGIKERFGPLTRISGVFYYTKWLSQHRSKVEMHELEYNMELLKLLDVKENLMDYELELPISSECVAKGLDKLANLGFKDAKKGYIVLHPGMGGSALNWKYAYYSELASRLYQQTKFPIVITGSASEQHITRAISNHVAGICWDTAGHLGLKELMGVISKACLFVGPSTGPLHIASATGVPTVGIYSPVKVQSARRWGPYTKNAAVTFPTVDCPGAFDCIGKRCKYYFCMDQITVEEIFEKAKSVMQGNVEQMSLKL